MMPFSRSLCKRPAFTRSRSASTLSRSSAFFCSLPLSHPDLDEIALFAICYSVNYLHIAKRAVLSGSSASASPGLVFHSLLFDGSI